MPLSDILACPLGSLPEIVTSENPYQHAQWYLAKNIGAIELSKLGELLNIGSYDEINEGFELVGEPLPDGPWPETVPPRLIDAVKTLTAVEIARVAEPWSGIEEFHGTASADDLAKYLQSLQEFINEHSGPYFLVNAL